MKKPKVKKYLDFYYKCMEAGRIPNKGLCECRILYSQIEPFCPTIEEMRELQPDVSLLYWGSEMSPSDMNRRYTFTPLRQTIVLFIAAINNEL